MHLASRASLNSKLNQFGRSQAIVSKRILYRDKQQSWLQKLLSDREGDDFHGRHLCSNHLWTCQEICMTAISSTIRHVKRVRIASTATNRRHSDMRKPAKCGQKVSATIALARCVTWKLKSHVQPRRAFGKINQEVAVNRTACSSIKSRNLAARLIRLQLAAWYPRFRSPPLGLRLQLLLRLTFFTQPHQPSFLTTIMRPCCPALSKSRIVEMKPTWTTGSTHLSSLFCSPCFQSV